MSITQTTKAQYTADTVLDIYARLLTGDEWAPYQRVEVGLDKPRVLPKGSSSQNLLQDNVANPRVATNASGDIAITYNLLTVDRAMSFLSITPEDWRADFPEFQPSGNTVDLTMNPMVLGMIMELLQNGINTELADLVYKGDDSLSSPDQLRFTDGYAVKLAADADVVDVANIGVITVNNVLDIIQDVENAIPARLRKRKAEIKIFMSYTTYDLAMEANRATQNARTLLEVQNVMKTNAGYEIVPMASMNDNEIMATPAGTSKMSNLVRGVWFEGDTSNLVMYREQPVDEIWAIALKFSFGVNYRDGADIVWYKGA